MVASSLPCIVAGTAERVAAAVAAGRYVELLESPKHIAQELPDIEIEVVEREAVEQADRLVAVVELVAGSQPQECKSVSAAATAVAQLIDRPVGKYKLEEVAVPSTSAVAEASPHIVVTAFEQKLCFPDEHMQKVEAECQVVRRIVAEGRSFVDTFVAWEQVDASTHLCPGKLLG